MPAVRFHRAWIVLILALALAPALSVAARAQLQTFEKSNLTIETAQGERRFAIELAVTPAQMEQGLMFRRSLGPDAGMLFEYDSAQRVAFWMKNTLIPLDMLFIAGDGRIVSIHERAVPLSTDNIESNAPVRAVLELNGGAAQRFGIKTGDVVRHPFFGNSPG